MDCQTSYSLEEHNKMSELKSLEFSTPEPIYESFASFENEKGQQFIIRARGCDRSGVEQYTRNLRTYLEVIPSESTQLPQEENIMPEVEAEKPSLQEEAISLEQVISPQQTRDIEVAFKVAKLQDIKQPYVLNFRLGAIQEVPISEGEDNSQTITYPIGIKPEVTVRVTSGRVTFELVRVRSGKQEVVATKKDVSGSDILNATERKSPGDVFFVRATGLEIQNEYFINGTVTVVSLADIKEQWL
jgi:hypothetical protein